MVIGAKWAPHFIGSSYWRFYNHVRWSSHLGLFLLSPSWSFIRYLWKPCTTYLGCEIERDLVNSTKRLSQTHYSIDVLKTFGHWDSTPAHTPMIPNTRLHKEDCNMNPDPLLHCRYWGIAGSLGYLFNITRPDLAWSYSEHSKYVQFPGKPHMLAAEHVLQHLCGTYTKII